MLEYLNDRRYNISKDINIKVRIDKKIVIFHQEKEPVILDQLTTKLVNKFNGGNIYRNIFIDGEQQKKYWETFEKLVSNKYLVETEDSYKIDLKSHWSLDEVFFELSKNCNLKCHHCYIPKNIGKNEMSFEKWKKIVDECYELGVGLIKLTGGEPMIAPYFWNLACYIKDKGIRMRVYTNGSLLDEYSIEKLVRHGILEIQISIDGGSEETHDYFRRTKGNFSNLMKALPLLDKSGIKTGLSFTASVYNYQEIQQFLDITYQYDNIKVNISPYINYHQTFTGNEILKVNDDILIDLKQHFENNKLKWSDKTRYYLSFSNKYIGFCGFGVYMLYIDSAGKIFLCPLLNQDEHVVGNLNTDSLGTIWRESVLLNDYRKNTIADLKGCNECSNANTCRGGCRARAFFNGKKLLCKDEVSCKMY